MLANAQGSMTACWTRSSPCLKHPITRWMRWAAIGVSALLMMSLTARAGQAEHPKVGRYSTAPEAIKIDGNLLRLEAQAQAQRLAFGKAAAAMALGTDQGGVESNIWLNWLDGDIAEQCR